MFQKTSDLIRINNRSRKIRFQTMTNVCIMTLNRLCINNESEYRIMKYFYQCE